MQRQDADAWSDVGSASDGSQARGADVQAGDGRCWLPRTLDQGQRLRGDGDGGVEADMLRAVLAAPVEPAGAADAEQGVAALNSNGRFVLGREGGLGAYWAAVYNVELAEGGGGGDSGDSGDSSGGGGPSARLRAVRVAGACPDACGAPGVAKALSRALTSANLTARACTGLADLSDVVAVDATQATRVFHGFAPARAPRAGVLDRIAAALGARTKGGAAAQVTPAGLAAADGGGAPLVVACLFGRGEPKGGGRRGAHDGGREWARFLVFTGAVARLKDGAQAQAQRAQTQGRPQQAQPRQAQHRQAQPQQAQAHAQHAQARRAQAGGGRRGRGRR